MKKDRNSFFSQYGVQGYNDSQPMYPNMNQNMFYPQSNNQDLIDRINYLERKINQIEQKLTKLEMTLPNTSTTNTDFNFANSMYMV